MTTRTYFLPPDFLSYPAPQPSNPGPIRLGQLILDINDPGHTVGTLPPLNMAGYDMPISTVNVTGMGHTENSSYSFYVRAFLKSVELVGLRFNIQVQNANQLLLAMEEVEAQTIEPKDSYVKASMECKEVQAELSRWWNRRRVFMVSGILIARPGDKSNISISNEQSSETSESVEGHGTAAHVPLDGGAAAGGKFSKEFGMAFVPKTPFIYGFRLRECFFKKGQGTSKVYYKGAKLHADGQVIEAAEKEDLYFEFSGVASKDLGFDGLGEAEDNFQEMSMPDEAENIACSLIASKAK